ncbi:anthranilate synthase component I [Hydrocarboniphaga effusa]|jgi:anthranilate synthase component 1|uniref:anthranilate synthase component I n=1 Tax=Hydrocarboniphaga effusa TaxID=243629 RepID=UPI0035B2FF00
MTAYTHVTLTRELPGDLDTPVSAYLKLAQGPYSFLFESMQGGERWGRYSFIGLPSRELIRVRGKLIERLIDGNIVESLQADSPFPYIKAYSENVRVKEAPGLPRFTGGLVGYFGYDCVRYIEPRINREHADPIGAPDVLLMRADELAIFDNLRCTLTLVVHAKADDADDQARAARRLDEIEASLLNPPAARALKPAAKTLTPDDFVSMFNPQSFGAAIDRVKDYIAAGDVMQVVPSQRLSAPFTTDAMTLYRTLRRLNPSPYLFCLDLDDHQVVGSSPEILVRVEDGEMTVRPIAGTRKRGATVEEDQALEADLLADPKELAEHLMLIDLGRNDVGRVAETGSVKLTDKMVIERYSHVMHIVSNVSGRLKEGMHALDALTAAFPAGTLSGAPKVRAMEIIDELEPVKRGIYGGAVGYLAWSGNLDTAIAIRTAVLKDGQIHVQAGAGIVADSDPASEWEETMNKARAMVRAAGLATGGRSA